MERISAMLQRKEQELLLEKEREAAENEGASTLELKLLVKEKLELQKKRLETVVESPQQARSNVLGILARRLNNSDQTKKPEAAPHEEPKAQKPDDDDKEVNRRHSLDDFMKSAAMALNQAGLSETEVEPAPEDEDEESRTSARNLVLEHIKVRSGMTDSVPAEALVEEETVNVLKETDPPVPDAPPPSIPSTNLAGFSSPSSAPPILPRSSSKRIGSMLQQRDGTFTNTSSPPNRVRNRTNSASDATTSAAYATITRDYQVSQLDISAPPNQFMTLRKADWGGWERKAKPNVEFEAAGRDADSGNMKLEALPTVVPVHIPTPRTSSVRPEVKAPERKLVLEGPAWTVTTIASLQECYLFLFSDILVVTKPYEKRASKRIFFRPLFVFHLPKCFLTFNDPGAPRKNNGLLLIDQDTRHKIETVVARTFESHPVKSVSYLVSKGVFPRTPSAIATFLLTTPRLSKTSIGKFLALQSHSLILQAYLRFLNFTNTDIVTSFRILLCAFRLPADESEKVDIILDAFVDRWLQCNPKSLAKILPPMASATNSQVSATDSALNATSQPNQRHWQHDSVRQVVFAMLALDFEVHYAQASVKEEAVFLNRFTNSLLPSLQASLKDRPDIGSISVTSCVKTHRDALLEIFNSIVDERLDMGEISGDKATTSSLQWSFTMDGPVGSPNTNVPANGNPPLLQFTSTTPFLNLPIHQRSPFITLKASRSVPGLHIEISGIDIHPEPRVLDFSRSSSATFRITGLSTGRKVVLFTRRWWSSGGSGNVGAKETPRGLENPAGIGILVEPEWLKFRFGVKEADWEEEEENGVHSSSASGTAPQVVALASEEVYSQWEETLKDLCKSASKSVSKNAMELSGYNPYGTVTPSRTNLELLSPASRRTLEEEETRVLMAKNRLLANEEPIPRTSILVQAGAIVDEGQ